MSSSSLSIAQLRAERALLDLERRIAGREPSRAERRLLSHYQRRIRALHDDTTGDLP